MHENTDRCFFFLRARCFLANDRGELGGTFRDSVCDMDLEPRQPLTYIPSIFESPFGTLLETLLSVDSQWSLDVGSASTYVSAP